MFHLKKKTSSYGGTPMEISHMAMGQNRDFASYDETLGYHCFKMKNAEQWWLEIDNCESSGHYIDHLK